MMKCQQTLLTRFVGNAYSFGSKLAVIQGENTVSYKTLLKNVASIANFLKDQGVDKGDRVALLMDNSPFYIATYYATWSIGGIAVTLNTGLIVSDVNNLCNHCGAKLIVYDKKFKLDGVSIPHHLADNIDTNTTQELDVSLFPAIADTASIIYTSGTTGAPKGVTLSHQNLASNTASIVEYLNLKSHDRVMCVLPFFYSYGNSLLHTHIATGASLVLENSFMYPQKVLEKMAQTEVTGFSGVPSTFALLLDRTKLKKTQIPSLRYITQAGGGMSTANIVQFREAWPKIDFLVMYGQTEASARLTYLPANKLEEKMGSAGKAIPGVELQIRNEQDEICPSNTQGEICAKGHNVMQGYWEDKEETTKTIKDGWLYTGDLGYMDEDGYIYIVGRNKEMIKVGSNRIAPREIEEKILELSGVLEVAAVGIPDRALGQIIKAFIVKRSDKNISIEPRDIMRHCKQKLAIYKIPKQVEFINELPKTASGKVKKHLLV